MATWTWYGFLLEISLRTECCLAYCGAADDVVRRRVRWPYMDTLLWKLSEAAMIPYTVVWNCVSSPFSRRPQSVLVSKVTRRRCLYGHMGFVGPSPTLLIFRHGVGNVLVTLTLTFIQTQTHPRFMVDLSQYPIYRSRIFESIVSVCNNFTRLKLVNISAHEFWKLWFYVF